MPDILQHTAVGAAVLLAVVYLARRVRRVLANKRDSSCGRCGTCPSDSSRPKQLVTLDPRPPGEGRAVPLPLEEGGERSEPGEGCCD